MKGNKQPNMKMGILIYHTIVTGPININTFIKIVKINLNVSFDFEAQTYKDVFNLLIVLKFLLESISFCTFLFFEFFLYFHKFYIL